MRRFVVCGQWSSLRTNQARKNRHSPDAPLAELVSSCDCLRIFSGCLGSLRGEGLDDRGELYSGSGGLHRNQHGCLLAGVG